MEKPLALTFEELDQVKTAYQKAMAAGKTPRLMVGFNRRFSPHIQKMKSLLGKIRRWV